MSSSGDSFYSSVIQQFGHEPNDGQVNLFEELEAFMRSKTHLDCLIVSGYAGTGKTTAMAAFVRALTGWKIKVTLLAPTGRAAKVFSGKSNTTASTIHRHIYWRNAKADLSAPFTLKPNLQRNTVFIVDESSMIGDYSVSNDGGVGRDLFGDLLQYVYSGPGCKLILVGDEGQLPPVGSDNSPAMDSNYLKHHFPAFHFRFSKLTEVLRQASESSILYNATKLRSTEWKSYPQFILQENKEDLKRINGQELQNELEAAMDRDGMDETLVIVRSNKSANEYNRQIRARILWFEEKICQGDLLMVVKNNYFWLDENQKIGFIANGEMIRVKRVLTTEELYGFEFSRLRIEFVDYPDFGDVEVIVHTEALDVEGPNLSRNRMKELFYQVEADYLHLKLKKERYDAILKDPYFNALQVKYAYAVTCHKSQGGQWKNVFVDQGYLNEELLNNDYYRWLYTAITRATTNCFLVNFSDEFFKD